MRQLLLVASLTIGAIAAVEAADADNAAPARSAARGEKLYMQNICYTCHGTVGQGGERTGPKLTPNPFPFAAFANQVRRPRRDMPRYSEEFLSDRDMADIYAYMLSVKPGPAAKDIPLLSF